VAAGPNLVFILSDEQSWDMVGAYGLSQVQTPHLDALAAEGVLFDHCVSSTPVCTPYRGMLMTGLHPLRNNCYENDRPLLTGIGDTFAQVLSGAGYRTAYIGKWHLFGGDRDRPVPPGPHRHGFDEVFWTNNCDLDFSPEHAFYWDGAERRRFGAWEMAGQTDQALDLLDRLDGDRPFALFLSYHAPHFHFGGDAEAYSWFDAPPECKARYDLDAVVPRRTIPDNATTRRMTLGHLALCSAVDDQVGRIVDRLRTLGLLDDTLVVYTSDHGETFGAYGNHSHKSCPEDVSVRVPLIMRLPGQPGRRSGLLVGTLDLMPTVLGLLGLPVPDHCQGTDLAPAITGGDDDAVASVPLFFFNAPWRGVYTRRWTYSVDNVDRSPQGLAMIESDRGATVLLRRFDTLYDRDTDPDQLVNLFGLRERAGRRGHVAVAAQLHRLTLDWMARFDDAFPTQVELAARAEPRCGS
jgi:arylsulfatase A-like enzyme